MGTFSLWQLSDSVFFAGLLFAAFALLIGFSFGGLSPQSRRVFQGLVYFTAGIACLIHTHPFAPGFYLDFREVPLALASSTLGSSWGVLIAVPLALYRWLVIGQDGAAVAIMQLGLVVVLASLLRRRGQRAAQQLKANALLAAFIFVPSSASVLLSFSLMNQPLGTALGLYVIKLFFSVVGFCLWSAVTSLVQHNIQVTKRYQRLASSDALTELHNRYAFEEDQPLDGQERYLLLLDLDHFKRINDRHGHLYGDQVLKHAAQVLKQRAEPLGRAYRVGGEEFALRLHGDAPRVEAFAEALRLELAEVLTKRFGSSEFPITISGGLVLDGPNAFSQADELLYLAKGAGRNMVVADWQPRPAVVPQSPSTTDSPGSTTIYTLLKFLAELDDNESALKGLLQAVILYVPGAEAGSLTVKQGQDSVVVTQIGHSASLLGRRYSCQQIQEWHGDPAAWQRGEARILTGQALQKLADSQSVSSLESLPRPSSDRRAELQANLLLPILVQGEVVAELNLDNLQRTDAFTDTSLTLATEFGLWAAAALLAHQKRVHIQAQYQSALMMLGMALEARERKELGHTQRIVALSSALGEHLDLSEIQQEALRQGAYLHDLGKLQLPNSVLLKPGKLSAEECKLMKSHTQLGEELALRFPHLAKGASDVIRAHHEHWNGQGYPNGVSGQNIPLLARVFAVTDVYDALVSPRSSKDALTVEAALNEINAQRGKQFDPEIVDAFLQLMHSTDGQNLRLENPPALLGDVPQLSRLIEDAGC